jgi:LmbE family N-acetylglucosaminyl deacetylase
VHDDPTPAIFYAPHADDEAIGMAGGILEHIAAGRPVYLVLITDGRNAGLLDILTRKDTPCPWHKVPHGFDLTMDDLIQGRSDELQRSGDALGVDQVYIEGLNDDDLVNGNDIAPIVNIIRKYEAMYPGASHKTANGFHDMDPPPNASSRNPTHLLCAQAGTWLHFRNEISDWRFYRIYEQFPPYRAQRSSTPSYTQQLSSDFIQKKQASLGVYKQFDPNNGIYGWGYHSAAFLIDAAWDNREEYIDDSDNATR